MAEVFISHSSADSEIAKMLYHQLEARGISCWISSKDIIPGEDWAKSINDAITKSSVFLIIYSKNSAKSTQVPREIGLAGARNLCIIPYKIDNTKLEGEFEYYLLNSHWITADVAKNDYKIDELCNAVYSATGKKTTSNSTYINTVNITEIKDNTVVYAPINIKKYKVQIAAAVILLILIFIIIGASRSSDKNKIEPQNDTSINVVIPTDENTIGTTKSLVTETTTEAQPANPNISAVPADLMPYEYNRTDILDNDFEKSVTVAGTEYNTAVVLNANYYDNQVMFNVGGEYQKMAFSAGRVDGSDYEKDVIVRIWLDGEEAEPFKVVKAELPNNYEYDITGVKHIKIAADSTHSSPQIAFTDFYLCKNIDDEVPSSASLTFDTKLDKLNIPSDLMPYEYHRTDILDNDFEKSITVAGAEYNTAVVLNSNYHENQVMFNVGGEYQKMTFSAGRVDGSDYEKDVIVHIWLDGEEAEPFKIVKSELPKNYEYDITGVKHIKIAADSTHFSPQIAFTDFYLTK